jgi:hypothetical protein
MHMQLKKQNILNCETVREPKYDFDTRLNIWRESTKDLPDRNIYYPVGYEDNLDEDPKEQEATIKDGVKVIDKHYRKYY